MKKFLLYIYFQCFISLVAIAQHTISGKIIDENNHPMEFVVLTITQNDSTIKEEVVKEEGEFSVSLPAGTFTFKVIYFGKIILTQNINVTQSENIGALKAIVGSLTLGEFVLEDTKNLIERKVDRLVFNVENTVAASGGDALDLLKVTPRVKVENDKIAMIGKSGMSVMIDDRITQLSGEELVNYLKNIPSDNIKSIEVITNPPAKYSAEGNSGLINIKLKKSIEDSWSTDIRTSYQQATYARGAIGGNFNYRKNKLSFYTIFYYSDGSNAHETISKVHYKEVLLNEEILGRSYFQPLNVKCGGDYNVSDKISMGFLVNSTKLFPNNSPSTTTSELINNQTQVIDSLIKTNSIDDKENQRNSVNYHLIYTLDTNNRKLSLDIDYFKIKNNTDRFFESTTFLNNGAISQGSFASANNKGNQQIENYSVNLDMEHPFKWATFNYGGRLTTTQTDNELHFFDLKTGIPIFDDAQSNTFIFTENTQAAYFSVHKELSKKWEAKAGLRAENTNTKGNSITINQTNTVQYFQFFPTAYLSYNPNDSNSFSLNYGRRINRPSFSFLNPFQYVYNQYSYSEGNPFLLPSFSHNLEFEYMFKDFWVNTIYLSKLENGFEQVTIVDSSGIVMRTVPENFIENTAIGLAENITIIPFKFLETNLFVDIYYSHTSSSKTFALNLLSGWNGYVGLSNDFKLNKKKTAFLNISYFYITKGVSNLDRNNDFDQLDIALKLLFWKEKMKLTFAGNDLLSSNRPEYTSVTNGIKNSFRNYTDNRDFRISISYNFGGTPKNYQKHENKNSEELNRTN
ncbi:MAG: TonB-dependent receptor [Flavobacteriales bacterium]|nr:TonB-dependent receptor [Flavobacteriales bacterium]MCB9363301.1 TonB-dependent receptor [Flavobacteriales bacterium]